MNQTEKEIVYNNIKDAARAAKEEAEKTSGFLALPFLIQSYQDAQNHTGVYANEMDETERLYHTLVLQSAVLLSLGMELPKP
jgi:hypothetical protein